MRRIHGRHAALTLTTLLVLGAGCSAPRSLPAVKASGDRYFERKDFDSALTDYQEYVNRDPGDPSVRISLAKTLLVAHRPTEAVEHAQIAYDQRTTDEDAIETLAHSLLDAGRQDEMNRLLRGLAETRGHTGDYIRLGRYLHLSGDADGAELALKQAARLDSGRTIAPQMALADFYHDIHDKPNELKRLRMALFIEPHNETILKRLRELGEVPGPSLALQPEEWGTP
jgi:predicted Zn-dependent protease